MQGFTLAAFVIAFEQYQSSGELPGKKAVPARSKRFRGKQGAI
jgi:hypothetical protein